MDPLNLCPLHTQPLDYLFIMIAHSYLSSHSILTASVILPQRECKNLGVHTFHLPSREAWQL